MFIKKKPIRLNGKKINELNKVIHERDGRCILCHKWVSIEEKFHHQKFGIHKQDRIECGCILCYSCHQEVHFGKNSKCLQQKIEDYLTDLYPVFWLNE